MGTQNPADAAHDADIRHPQTKVTMTVNPGNRTLAVTDRCRYGE